MKVLIKTRISEHRYKDANGYLICTNSILARTGKQDYIKSEIYENCDDNEIIAVDRKPEQVFDSATLASFENVPLTCEHPYENVNPDNYKEYSVGFVRDIHKGTYDGQDVMLGNLIVTNPQIIEDIENGYRTELSCGYDCDITEGENPEQINIRGNHVALCEQGRAGIARVIDNAIRDGLKLSEGCIIQDFGKKASKYKVKKIIGNTIYAQDLTDESDNFTLLKKDKLDIDYAVIKNAPMKDSKTDELKKTYGDDITQYVGEYLLLPENDKLSRSIVYDSEPEWDKFFEWCMSKKVKDSRVKDESFKYVIYEDESGMKGTSYTNYNSNNPDPSEIEDLSFCDGFRQTMNYLITHTDLKEEEIYQASKKLLEDSEGTDYTKGFSEEYYEKANKILNKTKKRIEKDDETLDEEKSDELRENISKTRKKLIEMINENIKANEEKLTKDSIKIKRRK